MKGHPTWSTVSSYAFSFCFYLTPSAPSGDAHTIPHHSAIANSTLLHPWAWTDATSPERRLCRCDYIATAHLPIQYYHRTLGMIHDNQVCRYASMANLARDSTCTKNTSPTPN